MRWRPTINRDHLYDPTIEVLERVQRLIQLKNFRALPRSARFLMLSMDSPQQRMMVLRVIDRNKRSRHAPWVHHGKNRSVRTLFWVKTHAYRKRNTLSPGYWQSLVNSDGKDCTLRWR